MPSHIFYQFQHCKYINLNIIEKKIYLIYDSSMFNFNCFKFRRKKKKISATGKIYDKNILYRDTFISMPLIDVK